MWAPKCRQLLKLQNQLERTLDALGFKLLVVATLSLLKNVVTLDVIMCNLENLTRGIQPFLLGQHTLAQRENVLAATERYSTVIGGGAVPLLANANIMLVPDGVYLITTFLQAWGQLKQTRMICACMFGVNADIMGKLADFVSMMRRNRCSSITCRVMRY